jgi:hypothetical protein
VNLNVNVTFDVTSRVANLFDNLALIPRIYAAVRRLEANLALDMGQLKSLITSLQGDMQTLATDGDQERATLKDLQDKLANGQTLSQQDIDDFNNSLTNLGAIHQGMVDAHNKVAQAVGGQPVTPAGGGTPGTPAP